MSIAMMQKTFFQTKAKKSQFCTTCQICQEQRVSYLWLISEI